MWAGVLLSWKLYERKLVRLLVFLMTIGILKQFLL
jgi:hypothetical protein